MGTHPNGPSSIVGCQGQTLLQLIESDPSFHLGSISSTTDIPYLLKVLSIHKVLSIQSHPDTALAQKLHATNPDVYKTPCHKPEMAVALTPFTAMLGFRPLTELRTNLLSYPEIMDVVGPDAWEGVLGAYDRTVGVGDFDTGVKEAVKSLFTNYMEKFPTLGPPALSSVLTRLNDKVDKTDLDNLVLDFAEQFPGDCGVLSPVFLNVISCSPGESVYVGSNTPHAYVSGEIIECMARSDNVIRCGLTPKFKDVGVLCESLKYDTYRPEVGKGEEVGEEGGMGSTRRYRPPVEDFEVRITTFKGGEGGRVDSGVDSGAILMVIEGGGTLRGTGGEEIEVGFGDGVFVSANTELEVVGGEEGIKFVRGMRNVG